MCVRLCAHTHTHGGTCCGLCCVRSCPPQVIACFYVWLFYCLHALSRGLPLCDRLPSAPRQASTTPTATLEAVLCLEQTLLGSLSQLGTAMGCVHVCLTVTVCAEPWVVCVPEMCAHALNPPGSATENQGTPRAHCPSLVLAGLAAVGCVALQHLVHLLSFPWSLLLPHPSPFHCSTAPMWLAPLEAKPTVWLRM